jgi:hypothetical protein
MTSIPDNPLSWKASFAIAALIMAFAAGAERKDEQRTRPASINDVNPAIAQMCTPNGGIAQVTTHPSDPYTFYITCRNGLVLTSGER